MGFGPFILQATIGQHCGTTEVYHINAAEKEREFEEINVTLVLCAELELEELSKLVNGQCTLSSFGGFDFELAERIASGHLIINGVVENSANISKVHVASISGW